MISDTLSLGMGLLARFRRCPRVAPVTALLLAVMLGAGGCAHESASPAEAAGNKNPVSVAVGKVARADLSQALRIAAEFRPFQEIEVHAKVAGYVKHIYVDVGDRVTQGQTLAVLEVPELQDELNQASASVRQSEQEVVKAQHELKRAEADYRVAHLAYSRLDSVFKNRPDVVAEQDVDDAQGKDEAADAQVAAAKAGLAAAQEHLDQGTDNRQRVQALFNYTQITAPFAGVITARYADTGAMLAAGTSSEKQALPLVQLAQNDLLRLDIPVPESIVPRIHAGTPVAVLVPAVGKTYRAKVVRFADRLDPSTRTMTTEVDVPNPTLELVPGMYAYATLTLERKPDALAVPVLALIHSGDQTRVLKVSSDDRIEEQTVALGIQTPSESEVLSGLRENDLVVIGQQSQLQPGEKVMPKLESPDQFEMNGVKK
ncbi:MAG TPA: efflux RND transporter periplasmic adaptor subunit [Terriglobia bacterium]|nr:efflux RND transporter periplasmic adaptor subunit [Terriglobia bacterium]